MAGLGRVRVFFLGAVSVASSGRKVKGFFRQVCRSRLYQIGSRFTKRKIFRSQVATPEEELVPSEGEIRDLDWMA